MARRPLLLKDSDQNALPLHIAFQGVYDGTWLLHVRGCDTIPLDVFGVGEHHRPEYAVSVPAVVLAAAAERTRKIRLTSAVTVLSSDDPVRVFQQFATLDLLSGGRAGALGLPLALAIIGGEPARFAPLLKLYREAARRAGHDATTLPVGINSLGYIADTSQEARDEHAPFYISMMNKLGPERGWPRIGRRDYDASSSPQGALVVGSPDEVIEKILFQHEVLGHQRFLMQSSAGAMPHHKILHAIKLFGTRVAPVVRLETAHDPALAESKEHRGLEKVPDAS